MRGVYNWLKKYYIGVIIFIIAALVCYLCFLEIIVDHHIFLAFSFLFLFFLALLISLVYTLKKKNYSNGFIIIVCVTLIGLTYYFWIKEWIVRGSIDVFFFFFKPVGEYIWDLRFFFIVDYKGKNWVIAEFINFWSWLWCLNYELVSYFFVEICNFYKNILTLFLASSKIF